MTEEIYQHLPRWRRIIRDLAAEAGLGNFLNSSDHEKNKSNEDPDSSTREDQAEHKENSR